MYIYTSVEFRKDEIKVEKEVGPSPLETRPPPQLDALHRPLR